MIPATVSGVDCKISVMPVRRRWRQKPSPAFLIQRVAIIRAYRTLSMIATMRAAEIKHPCRLFLFIESLIAKNIFITTRSSLCEPIVIRVGNGAETLLIFFKMRLIDFAFTA